jgi:hypothetical protein
MELCKYFRHNATYIYIIKNYSKSITMKTLDKIVLVIITIFFSLYLSGQSITGLVLNFPGSDSRTEITDIRQSDIILSEKMMETMIKNTNFNLMMYRNENIIKIEMDNYDYLKRKLGYIFRYNLSPFQTVIIF